MLIDEEDFYFDSFLWNKIALMDGSNAVQFLKVTINIWKYRNLGIYKIQTVRTISRFYTFTLFMSIENVFFRPIAFCSGIALFTGDTIKAMLVRGCPQLL